MGVPSPFVTAKQSPFLIAKQRALQPSEFPELPAAVEMSPRKQNAACVISEDKLEPAVRSGLDGPAAVAPRTASGFPDQAVVVRNTFIERADGPEGGSPLVLPRRRAESDWTGLPSWELASLAAELVELSLPPVCAYAWCYDTQAQYAQVVVNKWCYDDQAKSPSKDSAASTADSERPDSATSSDEAEERRIDFDDDVAYTFAEFCQKYGGRFQTHQILEYWDCLEPTDPRGQRM